MLVGIFLSSSFDVRCVHFTFSCTNKNAYFYDTKRYDTLFVALHQTFSRVVFSAFFYCIKHILIYGPKNQIARCTANAQTQSTQMRLNKSHAKQKNMEEL